jgi:hypothetical protein
MEQTVYKPSGAAQLMMINTVRAGMVALHAVGIYSSVYV